VGSTLDTQHSDNISLYDTVWQD